MSKNFEQQELIEILSGVQKVNMAKFLIQEIAFYHNMKDKFGSKEKLVDQTETRLRDIMWVFANAANTAFPEEPQIGHGSIGLLSDPLEQYNFTLLIEKKKAAE
jgi:hypothetical protein